MRTRCDGVNARAWSLLDAVGLADRAAESCANLAHGERRLLEIAISLATDAKLLLLDEPLAGLAEADRVVVARLIRQLAETHAVLLIEHDIDRVLALSDRISVLHQGRLIADGKAGRGRQQSRRRRRLSRHRAERGGACPCASHAKDRARRAEEAAGGVAASAAAIPAAWCWRISSLTVNEGEAVALLGRNGVGKTTTAARHHRHGARQRRQHCAGRRRHHPRQALPDQPSAASRWCRRAAGCSPT